MNTENTIEVLNTLIQINNDRIEGYGTASKDTEEEDIKTLFSHFMQNSEKCKKELVDEVIELDGVPVEGTSIVGVFHRVWMDVKAALTNKDRKAILKSCEYGDAAAVDTYQKALSNNTEHLTKQQLAIINAQYLLIKSDHNMVKSLVEALAVEEEEKQK
jgi:uncharacterized protein (TIGR02284 family)